MKLWTKIAVAVALATAPGMAMAQLGVGFQVPRDDGGQKDRLSVEQLRAKYQDAESRYIQIDGLNVHYKVEGNGPVLLLVHGSASTLRTWDGVAAALKNRYRVIRYDLPGFGLSDSVPDDMVGKLHVTDIPLAILKKEGVTKIAAASGVSSGGTLVTMLAAKYPGLVDRLVLSNMPADPVRTDHLVHPPKFDEALARANKTGFKDRAYWDEYLPFYAGVPARFTTKIRDEYYDFNRRVSDKNVTSYIAQVRDGSETTPLFASLKIPVLLAWGTADPLLPESAAHRLGDHYLPNADVSKLFMPDVSHYPPVEVPGRIAAIIDNYVTAVTPIPAYQRSDFHPTVTK